MVARTVGVVDDIAGSMVAVAVDEGQIVLRSAGIPWRTFDPSQITELIEYLETARDEALIAEINSPHDEADDE